MATRQRGDWVNGRGTIPSDADDDECGAVEMRAARIAEPLQSQYVVSSAEARLAMSGKRMRALKYG